MPEPTVAAGSLLVAQSVGAARILIFNRPERRNALVPEMAHRIADELTAAADDPGVRTVLLRGAGGHFCVGLDLKWYLSLGTTPDRQTLENGLRAFQDTIRAIVRSPLPVVAMLEGSVAGFGLDLALACDLRIASQTASLSSAFARMGLVPDGGATYTLPRLVGMEHALAILVGGETVDAERAQSIGLVTTVVSDDRLEDAAAALVERIAEQSASSITHIKRLARSDDRSLLDERLVVEGQAQIEALLSPEFRARLEAFLARAKPT
jgi:2-(1,2-epoxy-1,2-dihydrophenyl)acetyl-CoA isomerase